MQSKQDYYTILGVNRDASAEENKRANFNAAQKLHPDKNTAAGETELFLDVQQAYEVLSNAKRRLQYDATLPPEENPALPYTYKILYSRPNLVRLDEARRVPGDRRRGIPLRGRGLRGGGGAPRAARTSILALGARRPLDAIVRPRPSV